MGKCVLLIALVVMNYGVVDASQSLPDQRPSKMVLRRKPTTETRGYPRNVKDSNAWHPFRLNQNNFSDPTLIEDLFDSLPKLGGLLWKVKTDIRGTPMHIVIGNLAENQYNNSKEAFINKDKKYLTAREAYEMHLRAAPAKKMTDRNMQEAHEYGVIAGVGAATAAGGACFLAKIFALANISGIALGSALIYYGVRNWQTKKMSKEIFQNRAAWEKEQGALLETANAKKSFASAIFDDLLRPIEPADGTATNWYEINRDLDFSNLSVVPSTSTEQDDITVFGESGLTVQPLPSDLETKRAAYIAYEGRQYYVSKLRKMSRKLGFMSDAQWKKKKPKISGYAKRLVRGKDADFIRFVDARRNLYTADLLVAFAEYAQDVIIGVRSIVARRELMSPGEDKVRKLNRLLELYSFLSDTEGPATGSSSSSGSSGSSSST